MNRPDPSRLKSQQSWVLAASILGSTMAFVDASVINVALPRMEGDLQATLAAMTWVINAYTLCMAALLLIGGAAADQLGRRRIFVTGLVVFATASVGCGLAPNVQLLIGARAIQGVGAALLIPCSLAIIGAVFDEKQRGAAIGIWSGASALAAGLGPILGGWLVDHWSWRAIFLINPVIALPALWIALRRLDESHDAEAPAGLDWAGAALAFSGLGLLVYGLIDVSHHSWHSPMVLGAIAAGLVLLGIFVAVEMRSAAPMMPLNVFRSRTFSGVNLLTVLLYGALGGALFFLPFLLIQVHGYSATAAGAVFLPFTLVLGALSRWGGGLVERFGARLPLIVGPAVVAGAFALLSLPGSDGAYWSSFLLPMLILGFGMAITVAPLTTTVLNSVSQHQTGVASGINNAVAQVASLLLIGVLGSVGIATLNRALDEDLARANTAPEVREIVDSGRSGFVLPVMPPSASQETRARSRAILVTGYVTTVRHVMLIAAALALASSLIAAVMIEGPPARLVRGTHGTPASRI